GKTKTSLIAAIVSSEPKPLRQLMPVAPPALEHVVSKCLVKDPDERWQNAHDVGEELRWTRETGTVPASVSRLSSRSRTAIVLAFGAGAIVPGAGIFGVRNRLFPPRPTTLLNIQLPAQLPLASYGATNLAISPS